MLTSIIEGEKIVSKIKKKIIKFYEKIYEVKQKNNDKRQRKLLGVPKIMSLDQTLDYLIENKCSISRFGDGELKLAVGDSIRFQKYDEKLSERLREILISNDENCIVGVTDIFSDVKWMVKKAYDYTWRTVGHYRTQWTSILDLNKLYGNAYITRCYIDWKDKSKSLHYFTKLKKLWDGEEVIIIEGEKSRLGCNNDLFSGVNSIERILCPSKDAFSYYDEILEEAKKLDRRKLILLALGPTASILAYDLSKLGYRALDIGHVDIEYEWFLQGAVEKTRIIGKYTSEASEGDIVEDLNDFTYSSQIIAHIGCGRK